MTNRTWQQQTTLLQRADRRLGFTLVEVLVVFTIIGVLVALLIHSVDPCGANGLRIGPSCPVP